MPDQKTYNADDMAENGWTPVRECPDPDDHVLVQGYPAIADLATQWQERAEKAERERDEALAGVRVLARESIECHERITVGCGHPNHGESDHYCNPFLAATETRNMTARELLDAVWEAAYVPEDGIIPAGAEYVSRTDNRVWVSWSGRDRASVEESVERRLLDPPTPKRPDGAETFDPIVDAAIRGHSDITAPDVVHAISDAPAEEGVRAPERGGR